jgi:hypothetical protein
MTTSSINQRPSRLVAAAAAVAAIATFSAPASAFEPRPHPAPVNESAWAEPQPALAGVPLAVYVSRHVERIIGPVGG